MPAVEILMAAYQGGSYIAAQIDSILAQTCTDWVLRIRDDCSADGTADVAARYAASHPGRVVAERRPTNSGSAHRNFLELLQTSTSPYVMLSDDDDVWLEDKIAATLQEMRRIEAEVGPGTPVLVHTDLSVTDEQLAVVSLSMSHSQRLAARETRLARLLVQNSVTGCTVMVNRALADLVREPFDGIAMHDWWLALLAAAFGRTGYVATPTMLYRQHGRNAVGAVDARDGRYVLDRAAGGDETRARMRAAVVQAAAFLDRYGDLLAPGDRATVAALAHLDRHGKLGRVAALARHGLWKNTPLRRLGQVVYV